MSACPSLREEFLQRYEVLNDFSRFTQYHDPNYILNWHHIATAEALQKLVERKINRLIVVEPPRHGKSRQAAIEMPLWAWSRNPKEQIVVSSYALSLSMTHASQVRRALDKEILLYLNDELTIQRGRDTQHEFWNSAGGYYFAVGVGGALTGRGVDIGVNDDLLKDRKSAESDVIRNAAWDWYTSTFLTRLSPEAVHVNIATRWHPDDPIGRLIKQAKEDGESLEVLHFPALSKPGEPFTPHDDWEDGIALWPDRYSLDALKRIRREIGLYEWQSLYQGTPEYRGGNMFKTDRIKWHDDASEFPNCQYVRSYDLAFTEKQTVKHDPDFTASVLIGVTMEQDAHDEKLKLPHIWIKHANGGQLGRSRRAQLIQSNSERDGASVPILIEYIGASSRDAVEEAKEALKGTRTIIPYQMQGDKVVKAGPVEPVFEEGNVHMLRGPWNDQVLVQLRAFPNKGIHDDYPDTISNGFDYCMKQLKQHHGNVNFHALGAR